MFPIAVVVVGAVAVAKVGALAAVVGSLVPLLTRLDEIVKLFTKISTHVCRLRDTLQGKKRKPGKPRHLHRTQRQSSIPSRVRNARRHRLFRGRHSPTRRSPVHRHAASGDRRPIHIVIVKGDGVCVIVVFGK